jgi:hypothetical protein
MVSFVEASPWAALIVLILTSPKIIRAIARYTSQSNE